MMQIFLFIILVISSVYAQTSDSLSKQEAEVNMHQCLDTEICAEGVMPLNVEVSSSEELKAEVFGSTIKQSVDDYLKTALDWKVKPVEVSKVEILSKKINPDGSYTLQVNAHVLSKDTEVKSKSITAGSWFFSWGYNRGIYTINDSTFKTSEGTFTVHGSKGYDRPTEFTLKYFDPKLISIPQYNFKIGYSPNERITYVVGMDHMKWVFDNKNTYKVTGDFSPKIFDNGKELDWNKDVLQDGNVKWLKFEHTDGYNYAFVGVEFNQPIVKTKNENFKIEAREGIGFGLMIPRTEVAFNRDQPWQWNDVNNKFHVAGWASHVSLAARFTLFKHFFVQADAWGAAVKINNALVDGSDARLEQTLTGAAQFKGSVGYIHLLGKKKSKNK